MIQNMSLDMTHISYKDYYAVKPDNRHSKVWRIN